MSEDRPPHLPPRRRLDIEQPIGVGGMARRGSLVIYGLVTVALIAVTLYMALIENRPLLSGWVAAPAIGAVWFGLRMFMLLGSRR